MEEQAVQGKKKIGLSIICGLLFGLMAGFVIVIILSVYRQETKQIVNAQDDATYVIKEDTEDVESKEAASEESVVDRNDSVDTDSINEMNENAEIEVAEATESQEMVVTDVTEVVEKVMPCVVSIFGTYIVEDSFWGYSYDYEQEGGGSGIIVGENDTELLIATNNHVVEGSEELTVQFIDDSVAKADIKGTDKDMDLAVIAIRLEDIDPATKKEIRIATLGNSDLLKVGEPAIAIGNALGYGQSVTTGVISAVNRAYTDDEGPIYGMEKKTDSKSRTKYLIQTDAAINPGNSGGALLNVRGEVIGINSSKIASYSTEGMGYAIPISTAGPIIEELMTRKTHATGKKESTAYLGVSGMAVTGEILEKYNIQKGIYVTQVFDGTPAKKGGIGKGDIILKIDSRSVGNMEELSEVLIDYEEGDQVEIQLLSRSNNGYTESMVTVILGGK